MVSAQGEQISSIRTAFLRQKDQSLKLRIEPLENRFERLQKVRKWIHANREDIHKAMYLDFKKPSAEVDGIELFHVLKEIKTATAHLHEWAAAKKIDAPPDMIGTRSWVYYEPKGVTLIIAPWNYPFSLCIGPLVSALAAGNTAIIKPSEHTPQVSSLIKRMASEIFAEDIVAVAEGDASVSQALLSLPFDHIFFTGSPSVGKVVMRAAAENLASVTLELGGKSPAIVMSSANLREAAQRIAVGKFVNNGQTCVAPDYVLVHDDIKDAFCKALTIQIEKLFKGSTTWQESASYARIINDHHYLRLLTLLNDTLKSGASLLYGGEHNAGSRFFHPTVLENVRLDQPIMQDEIFGPILPILSFSNFKDVINIINTKPKALALYIFSTRKTEWKKVLAETSSGTSCVNDCGIQFLHHYLPFGGVNNSGMGKSHGYYGFLAFSNEKAVLKQRSGMTTVKLFYPPYTKRLKRIMDWFLKLY